jgi:hypothetical protein
MAITTIYQVSVSYLGIDSDHSEKIRLALENVVLKWNCDNMESHAQSPCSEPMIIVDCDTRHDAQNLYEKLKRVIIHMNGNIIF